MHLKSSQSSFYDSFARVLQQPQLWSLLWPQWRKLVLLGLLGGLLIGLQAWQNLQHAQREQEQWLQHNGAAFVAHLEDLISEYHRSLSIFTQEHSEELNQLLSQPHNEPLEAKLFDRLKGYFPAIIDFNLAGSDGVPRLNTFSGHLGPVCLQDIDHFLQDFHPRIRIHRNPLGLHFDIMQAWQWGTESGVLLASYDPQIVIDLLDRHRLDGFPIYLLNRDQPSQVELAPGLQIQGFKTLDLAQLERVAYQQPVNGTQWLFAQIPDTDAWRPLWMEFGFRGLLLFSLYLFLSSVFLVGMEQVSLQRRKAELSWRQSELRINKLFRHSHDAIFLIDTQNRMIVDANPVACEMVKYSLAELKHKDLKAITSDGLPDLQALMKRGEDVTELTEITCVDHQGNPIPGKARATLTPFEDRHLIMLIISDRSAQYRREEVLDTLISGAGSRTGENFFHLLLQKLSEYFGAEHVLLLEYAANQNEHFLIRLAYSDGLYKSRLRLDMKDCPCLDSDDLVWVETDAQNRYPGSALLNRYDADSFISKRLKNDAGATIGMFLLMHDKALPFDQGDSDLLQVFAVRSEAELSREHLLEKIQKELSRVTASMNSINDAVITTTLDGCIETMNPNAEKLSGWSLHEALGQPLEKVMIIRVDGSGEEIANPALAAIAKNGTVQSKTNHYLVSRNSKRHPIEGSASPIMSSVGPTGAVLVFRDVSESHQMKRQMEHQASHDALTGLVNRIEFEARLQRALSSAKQHRKNHALLYLDLDQFKLVNDSAGHAAGDELLVQISTLLAEQLRTRDTLARLGGDEFSILLENCPLAQAQRVGKQIVEEVQAYRFLWKNKTYQIGVSIGVVPINANTETSQEIMAQADLACYSAKNLGRAQVHVFRSEDARMARLQNEVLQASSLREAIEQERFVLMWQPIVDLNDPQHLHGEVLLRLLGPNNEIIPAGSFIPAAERYGLMPLVDLWVIRTVFRDFESIFVNNPQLMLSINLSGSTLSDPELAQDIERRFHNSAIAPGQICFEITETTAINSISLAREFIAQMREIGCCFALDDFGSGLSSFSYLKNLHIDYLKIDGSFVKDVCDDPIDQAMIEAIQAVAERMNILTIAEYVENAEIQEKLRDIGVNLLQGYHLGRPEPLKQVFGLE